MHWGYYAGAAAVVVGVGYYAMQRRDSAVSPVSSTPPVRPGGMLDYVTGAVRDTVKRIDPRPPPDAPTVKASAGVTGAIDQAVADTLTDVAHAVKDPIGTAQEKANQVMKNVQSLGGFFK